MIEKEEIERIKKDIDLIALIESKGIPLKKNGKGYVGLCPFHDDTNPSFSVNPSTNLWNCFGCDSGGDAIRFVELFDKVDFKEAVNQLTGFPVKLRNGTGRDQVSVKPKKPSTSKPAPYTVKERKLLSKVAAYYQHTLSQDSRGLTYLKQERGITDNQSIKEFCAGYANGTLLEILPDDEEVIKSLKKIGILNSKGHELFYNCVTFPLYDTNGTIVNLYGRNIDDENEVSHLYLPGVRTGLLNRYV